MNGSTCRNHGAYYFDGANEDCPACVREKQEELNEVTIQEILNIAVNPNYSHRYAISEIRNILKIYKEALP